ncbi:SAM-dependent methyltransferase domain trio protein [Thermosynechococcus sp. NK55a]|uniref:class I SAM-dependent methyltransferase n=1 Tax=Thermosynechococcus sp. NK55a TaxID=1394889 RepID=UPI0003D94563|nr:class I SAM-dependent methyltransferase [Thermosynechococcus sp. NK55a]AHB89368.1 SAM-dependent methyltransferase domain trio protein [Thermosynechococcus sp. NK55a]
MNCRHCNAPLELVLIDLGTQPPSNAYLGAEALRMPERWYPLRVLVCEQCWLVQTEDFAQPQELFSPDYAYFSGYSSSWLAHCARFVGEAVQRFGLGPDSHVVEVAANDGYLLQFVQARGIPCLGIEPTASTAAAARAKGIAIVQDFFGVRLAQLLASEGRQADLMIANNVLAHVPDINDFVAGFTILLKPQGVATFEFPHLLRLLAEVQFDTIYHEHFSYLSLTAVEHIFTRAGLTIFDVEALPTHGGSLRIYAQRADTGKQPISDRVDALLEEERAAGLTQRATYSGFQERAERIKDDFLEFLLTAKREGKRVAAYGAAAKGNTLLNFAGVKPDLLPFVVDKNPAKQGKYLPGSRIPIVSEEKLKETQPDYIVILPWNLREEIMAQLAYVQAWGGQFVIAVPALEVSKGKMT